MCSPHSRPQMSPSSRGAGAQLTEARSCGVRPGGGADSPGSTALSSDPEGGLPGAGQRACVPLIKVPGAGKEPHGVACDQAVPRGPPRCAQRGQATSHLTLCRLFAHQADRSVFNCSHSIDVSQESSGHLAHSAHASIERSRGACTCGMSLVCRAQRSCKERLVPDHVRSFAGSFRNASQPPHPDTSAPRPGASLRGA